MKITKQQLQQIIKEELEEEMGEKRISGKEMLAMSDAELGLDTMSKEDAMEEKEFFPYRSRSLRKSFRIN